MQGHDLKLSKRPMAIKENYSDERFLCSTPQSCLANVCTKKQKLRKIIEFRGIKNQRGFKGFTSDNRS